MHPAETIITDPQEALKRFKPTEVHLRKSICCKQAFPPAMFFRCFTPGRKFTHIGIPSQI